MSTAFKVFRKRLAKAVALEHPYDHRMPNQTGTPAAVLAVFAAGPERGDDPALLVTRRTEKVEKHKGQMAFPGGMSEPGEEVDLAITALRETEEEVGLLRGDVAVLGRLPALWTPTGFLITPFVGVVERPSAEVTLHLNEHEIAEAFWVPLSQLEHPTTYRTESRRIGEVLYTTHVYQVGAHMIWGATGSMIHNLLERLKKVG